MKVPQLELYWDVMIPVAEFGQGDLQERKIGVELIFNVLAFIDFYLKIGLILPVKLKERASFGKEPTCIDEISRDDLKLN